MTRFILVHGNYHGSWCWKKVVRLLKSKGHHAVAVDLPDDPDTQLEDYMNVITQQMNGSEKVYLVGHSSGGHIVSAVAERFPRSILGVAYLSAVLLPSNRNATEIPRNSHEIPRRPRLMNTGKTQYYLCENKQDEAMIINYFYHDCREEEAKDAVKRLRRQPVAPLLTPITLTNERFGAVPKVYIELLDDHIIFPTVQRKMQQYWPLDQVYSLYSGHSPFLSCPHELVSILCKAAEAASARQGDQ